MEEGIAPIFRPRHENAIEVGFSRANSSRRAMRLGLAQQRAGGFGRGETHAHERGGIWSWRRARMADQRQATGDRCGAATAPEELGVHPAG